MYSVNDGYQSTEQRHNNKIIKRYYSRDNDINVY